MFSARNLLTLTLALGLVSSALADDKPLSPDKLTPADADALAVLNVRQALDSPVTKKFALTMLKDYINNNAEAKKKKSEPKPAKPREMPKL